MLEKDALVASIQTQRIAWYVPYNVGVDRHASNDLLAGTGIHLRTSERSVQRWRFQGPLREDATI